MYVTKYVEEDYFEPTKSGFLKFGTLASYRESEAVADLRLTDTEEGVSKAFAKDDIINGSFQVRGTTVKNSTMVGPGASVLVEDVFEAHIFCAVDGAYNRNHHRDFNNKNDGNVGNFITFDLALFASATYAFFKSIPFLEGENLIHHSVNYLRNKDVELNFE